MSIADELVELRIRIRKGTETPEVISELQARVDEIEQAQADSEKSKESKKS